MKLLVNQMPKRKEECFFYKKEYYGGINITSEYCELNGKACSFKNGESIFGGQCRCLKADPIRD